MSANSLQAVLDRASREPSPAPIVDAPATATKPVANRAQPKRQAVARPAVEDQPAKFYRPSRDGQKFVGGHFHPSVAKQLKLIAVEDDSTVQDLLEEALDLLFIKKGRAKVADLSR